MINGSPFLIGYQQDKGALTVVRINDDLNGTTQQLYAGWYQEQTIVEPFYIEGSSRVYFLTYEESMITTPDHNPILVAYQQSGGKWELTTVWQGHWNSNWSIIKPFYLEGSTFVFSYSPSLIGGATVAIDKLNPNGTQEVWRNEGWSSSWKQIEPFYMNGQTYLASYQATGTIAFDQVNAGGQGTTELWRGDFLSTNDIMKMFYFRDKPHVLTYSSASGYWEAYQVNDDVKGCRLISTETWTPGIMEAPWKIVEPFYKGKNCYFFACNFEESAFFDLPCQVAIGQFSPDDNLIETLWSDQWGGGWTQIKPFYEPPTPYPPVVPA